MIITGATTQLPFYSNNDYDPHSAKPTKHFTDVLELADQVGRGGSEWVRSIAHTIVLDQDFSDFYCESIVDVIPLADTVIGALNLPVSASDVMSFSDSFTFNGHFWTPQNGIETIFDSNTHKGMAIYITGSAHAELAKANNMMTTNCMGLANEEVIAGKVGSYLSDGIVEKFDWTAVTGTINLIPGALYYLSKDIAGMLTTIAPGGIGEYIVKVGRAITTTAFDIRIAQEVLL